MDNYWTRTAKHQVGRRRMLMGMGTAGAGAAALALAGCGDDDDAPAGGGATQAPGGTTAPAATPTPQSFLASIPLDPPDPTPVAQFKSGGTMTRITDRPFGFDHFTAGAANNVSEVLVGVYSRLLRTANRAGMKSVYAPDLEGDLAASWEQPDETTIVFQLRPGIKFQNVPPLNGREFKIDDIKYSINRGQTHTKNANKTDFRRVTAVEDVGGGKVRLKLDKPYFPILTIVANPTWVMTPPEIGGDASNVAQTAVGTGAFIVSKATPNVEVVYRKNPDYFRKDSAGKQLPYLDGYTLAFIADPATRLATVEGGKADSAYQSSTPVTVDNVEALAKRNPGKFVFQMIAQTMPNFYLTGHVPKAPWSDPRFRRAMSMLMDRAVIIKTIHSGFAQIGPHLPWTTAFDKEPKLGDLGPNYQFDVTAAKQLLSAAGIAPGTEFQLDWYESGQVESMVTLYAQTVALAGIKIKLNKNTDITAQQAKLQAKSWPDLTVVGRGVTLLDIEGVPGSFLPNHPVNYQEVNDPDFNRIYEQLQTARGDARRVLSKQMWDRHLDQVFEMAMPKQYDLSWWSTRLHNWRNTTALGNFGYGSHDEVWLSS